MQIQLEITENALKQIQVIQQNDYTLEGMSFRVKIGGKGCGGFTYETGFSEALPDDIILNVQGATILMDPFTAHYTQNARLDFQIDTAANEDGFVVENFEGDKFKGKFFKDPSLVPNWSTK